MKLDDHLKCQCPHKFRRPGGSWTTCRSKVCSTEALLEYQSRKSLSLEYGIRVYRPDLQALYFVTVKLDHLDDWNVLDQVRTRLKRLLKSSGVEYIGCIDYSTVGLHLHVLVLAPDRAHGISKDALSKLCLKAARDCGVENPSTHIRRAKSLGGSIAYLVGWKDSDRRWLIPKSWARKHFLFYPQNLFRDGGSLSQVDQEWGRARRRVYESKRSPDLDVELDPDLDDDRERRELQKLRRVHYSQEYAFDRSYPLIEKVDGPMWRRAGVQGHG